MIRTLSSIVVCTLLSVAVATADSPQFRGAGGSGKFKEDGLLEKWPEKGPKMLWSLDGLGQSYASVTVVGDRLYTTGMTEEKGTVYAISTDGELLWQKEYGPEFDGRGYPGTRTTPTHAGGNLYLLTSQGKAVALQAKDGDVLWSRDLLTEFKGENTYFGMSESPLVLDGKVIYTPGGPDASVVALNPDSGKTIWTSKGLDDSSAYCTPRLFENGENRQLITLVAAHMVGLNPDTGAVLWQQPHEVKYNIQAVAPVFDGNLIYVSNGYKQGGHMYELSADGSSVEHRWSEKKLDIHHGGAVVLDGHVYGAASGGNWFVLEAETGKIAAKIMGAGKGSLVYADGLLYGYTEDGMVHLVNPDPSTFEIVSSFEITKGSGHHWSHPAIVDKVLYIRHGEALMAFDVAAQP